MSLKLAHISLGLLSFCGFVSRIGLREFWPQYARGRWLKIVPPVLDTALLATGVLLAVQGHWLMPVAPWLAAKLSALLAYIVFGIAAMRMHGSGRWYAFGAALICFAYVVLAALTKQTGIIQG